MVAKSDMAVCLAAVRPDLMALCDPLEQQLNQADQQRRRLLLPSHARTHPHPGIQVASRRQGRGSAARSGKENF